MHRNFKKNLKYFEKKNCETYEKVSINYGIIKILQKTSKRILLLKNVRVAYENFKIFLKYV